MRTISLLLLTFFLASCNLAIEGTEQVTTVPPDDELGEPETGLPWYVITETQTATVVGCENYVTTVNSTVQPSENLGNTVRDLLNAMFAANEAFLEESVALTNFWGGDRTEVQSAEFAGVRLDVDLNGELLLQGVCSDAAMEAQLLLTIFQFEEIEEAYITIEGENLKGLFDTSGLVGGDEPYTRFDLPTAAPDAETE